MPRSSPPAARSPGPVSAPTRSPTGSRPDGDGGGLIITSVTKDTPAGQAGLSQLVSRTFAHGDFLLLWKIDSTTVTTQQQYVDLLKQKVTGQRVVMHVVAITPYGCIEDAWAKTITMP